MTASIVIYDALHIRFFAGEQAKVLNNITKALNKSDKSILPSRFKHPLGHILPEVIGGIIVGLATTIIAYIIHAHILEWLQFVLTKNI
jgi:acid phosphatase family membrane protein YuiD